MNQFTEKLRTLNYLLTDNIKSLLQELNIHYRDNGNYITMSCKLHESNSPRSLSFVTNEYSDFRGTWSCWSRKCHEIYGKSILGFLYGYFKTQQNSQITKQETINWAVKFLGLKSLNDIKEDSQEIVKKKKCFEPQTILILTLIEHPTRHLRKNKQKKILNIPSQYFLKRGFLHNLLSKYFIGDYNSIERASVPIFSDDGKLIEGWTARSWYDECPKCKLYHKKEKEEGEGECPPEEKYQEYVKWRHSKGFNSGQYLYNYWFAQPHIQKTKKLILVESVGNILRLVENGVENCLGLFGTNLTDPQELIISRLGVQQIFILMDNDKNKTGQIASQSIYKRLRRRFNVKILSVEPFNDVADCSPKFIQEKIIKEIEK